MRLDNIVTALLISRCLCMPILPIKDQRIRRLIKEIFYIPPLGENYINASIVLVTKSNVCSNGVCVPFHLCGHGNVLRLGQNIAPRRGVIEKKNGAPYCYGTEKCCKLYDDDSDEHNLYTKVQKFEQPSRHKCGMQQSNVLRPRFSGIARAEGIEYPWMVMILQMNISTHYYRYECGGSLIHPSSVLTAAHCVAQIDLNVLHIRVGEEDLSNNDEIVAYQFRKVQSMVIHHGYNDATLLNDIAILILKAPVELAENVNPICLPPPKYSLNRERCLVSGWSKNNSRSKIPSVLEKVELPIIPRLRCQMMLRKTILGKYFRLDRTFLCAGGEYNNDSCLGDGGSPLVCKISTTGDVYYQTGIASWGLGCKESNRPGAFVNVARYRVWIDRIMSRRKLNVNLYSNTSS